MWRTVALTVAILVVVITVGATTDQTVGRAADDARASGEWRHAYTADDGLHCAGPGHRCEVELRLVNATRLTTFHDADLAECTARVNKILAKLSMPKGDSSRRACLIVTPAGPFLAWAVTEANDQRKQQPQPSHADDNPAVFFQALGLGEEVARAAVRDYCAHPESGGVLCFRSNVVGQIAARLVTPVRQSRIHDSDLQARTTEINDLLADYARKSKNPKLSLAFLVTPNGLFLAWTENSDIQPPFPEGTITSQSDSKAIARVLGINR